MESDIIIIGGGAAGLMAAYGAAQELSGNGDPGKVTVLEKMPRPGRKIMLTGKGRCNFTNVKDWEAFSAHIRAGRSAVRHSFFSLSPEKMVGFINSFGTETVVERGDRAFPASYHASDIVYTLVRACTKAGAEIITGSETVSVSIDENGKTFSVEDSRGRIYRCRKLIIATGGLSYPATGSTGDGYAFAGSFGHRTVGTFPSLTALVPAGYKVTEKPSIGMIAAKALDGYGGFVGKNDHPDLPEGYPETKGHINRNLPLSSLGETLCGLHLKNVGLTVIENGTAVETVTGDVDFTDGGLEGPAGFQVSRRCVKAMINGAKISLVLDMKPGVLAGELENRVRGLWEGIRNDRRSERMSFTNRYNVLLGKLLPREAIRAFRIMNRNVEDMIQLCKALKGWKFDIAGYVGYERCVVTAGGVDTAGIIPKTMESRLCKGLYLCGEVLDIDADTGGYNLQMAFCTGLLAGRSAANSLISSRT